jgi:MYXO-CTERM domain-containing protein
MMKRFLSLGALVLVLGAAARADSVTAQYDNSGGSSNGYGAGTFTVHDITTGATFKAFCVDLYDTVGYGPYTYPATLTSGVPDTTPTFPAHGTSGIGNQVSYLIGTIWKGGAHFNTDQNAAMQTALWYVIQAGVHHVNTDNVGAPDGDIAKDYYNNLINLVTQGAHGYAESFNLNGINSWLSGIDPYDPSHTYGGAFLVTPYPSNPGGQAYQTLVGYTPEPSSMAIAALGALGLVGYGLRRKRA